MLSRRAFLAITSGALAAPRVFAEAVGFPAMLDHILLGCSDLAAGIAFLQKHTIIPPAYGGAHPGRGTRNALLCLGELRGDDPNPRRYLEIIAPDPAQSGMRDRLGLQKLTEPRLVGWAAHPGNLEDFAARLHAAGLAFGGPTPGSRTRPDGPLLQWKTLNLHDDHGGLLPFSIVRNATPAPPPSTRLAAAISKATNFSLPIPTPSRKSLINSASAWQFPKRPIRKLALSSAVQGTSCV